MIFIPCVQAQKPQKSFISPSGERIQLELALSDKAQSQGLSGRKKGSLKFNQGMLFIYNYDAYRSFWMPDTYFNLDIFFLNKQLRIVHVARNVPHHPGRQEPPAIARTKSIKCRYVLEMSTDSFISKKLKKGDSLKWFSPKKTLLKTK